MADNDWISALTRLTSRGLPEDTALYAGSPFSGPFSRTERAEQGGVEALPLGDPADPISQIAMILAPFLSQYRGIQAPVQELGMPARRTLPTPGLPALTETAGRSTDAAVARMRALQEGGLPGTRLTTPRPREQLYRADAPIGQEPFEFNVDDDVRQTMMPSEYRSGLIDMPPNMPDTSSTGLLHSGIRERLAHLRSQGIDTSGFEHIYGDIQHAAATMENYGEAQELTELHRQLSRAMASSYRSGAAEQALRTRSIPPPAASEELDDQFWGLSQEINRDLQEAQHSGIDIARISREHGDILQRYIERPAGQDVSQTWLDHLRALSEQLAHLMGDIPL